MEESSEDPITDEEFDRFMQSTSRGRRRPLVARRIDGVGVGDLAWRHVHCALPPHRKYILLMMLLVLKDQATGIRVEPYPWEDSEGSFGLWVRMQYEVN